MTLFITILKIILVAFSIASVLFVIYVLIRAIKKIDSTLTYFVKTQNETNKRHEDTITSIQDLIKALFEFKEDSKQQIIEVRQLIMDQRGDELKKQIECAGHRKVTESHSKKIDKLDKDLKKVAQKVKIELND